MVSAPYDLNRCCNPDAPTAARVRVRTASSLSQPPPVNKACIRAGGSPVLDAPSLPSPQVQYLATHAPGGYAGPQQLTTTQ